MKYYTEVELSEILDTMNIQDSERFIGLNKLLDKFKGDIEKTRKYLLIGTNSGEVNNYIENDLIPEIKRRKEL